MSEHLTRVQRGEGPVLPWFDPRDNMRLAREQLRPDGDHSATPTRESTLARFAELAQLALSRGHNLHNPRYIGHQVPASVPIAALFDAISAVMNNPMAIYEMGPWSTAVEQAMIAELCGQVGWGDLDCGGIVTHGASLANLTAMLVARNRACEGSWEQGVPAGGESPVIFTQADAHYCITRAGGMLGIGTERVEKIPLDERRRMDVNRLRERVIAARTAGRKILAVVASACATPIGAFDPLRDVADVCREFDLWMHVDAAHGGAALLSPKYQGLVDGIDLADSLTWDAHKMMFVPALCAFLLYRRKSDSYQAFRQSAPYLFDPSAPELIDFDGGLRTVECTKRGMVLGLWGVWSLFGKELLSDLVERTFTMGRAFYEMLAAAPDFEPLHVPECNIVVFRHYPTALRDAPEGAVGEFHHALRRTVCKSGRFYIVPCSLDGRIALRCTVINPLTTADHLAELLDTLRETGRTLLEPRTA
jgi:L-2,4-diaminobutyrate decarboxylase